MLRCADGALYTGYTTDVLRRVREHNGDGTTATARSAGARYTRARRPVALIYTERFESRSEALQREAAIKKLPKPAKEKLILVV